MTNSLIGQFVLFYRATLHGEGRMRGKVIRLLPNGNYEVRGVLGGYYEVTADNLSRAKADREQEWVAAYVAEGLGEW